MDFSLDDDQRALQDAVRRFLASAYPYESRGTPVDDATARTRWQALADMGLLGLPFETRWSGAGQGLVELALLAREMGRCHAGEGLLASVVLGGRLLQQSGNARLCDRWLPRIAAGQARLALAHAEPASRHALAHVQTRARPTRGGGHRLDGHKSLVISGGQADALLVLARTGGAVHDREGLSLFLVARDAAGLSVEDFQTLDGRRAAHLRLDGVCVDGDAVVGALGQAWPLIEPAVDGALVWTCAEAVGAMDTLIDTTVAHLKHRRQFGAPLSRLQALQHRLADAVIAQEQAEAMAFAAAMVAEQGPADLRRRVMATAKATASLAGQQVGEAAIQLHGAMGMTDECRVGHFAKLLMTLGLLFGDAHHHTRWFAEQVLDDDEPDTPLTWQVQGTTPLSEKAA